MGKRISCTLTLTFIWFVAMYALEIAAGSTEPFKLPFYSCLPAAFGVYAGYSYAEKEDK